MQTRATGAATGRTGEAEWSIVTLTGHAFVRYGLKVLLESALPNARVTSVADLAELLAHVGRHPTSLLVLDADHLQLRADAANAHLDALVSLPVKCVLLSAQPQSLPSQALRDWVGANYDPGGNIAGLVKAVKELLTDDVMAVPQGGVDAWKDEDPVAQVSQRLSTLTKREREVMELIRLGMPNKVIARALSVELTTVRSHRQRLMNKLRVKSAVQVAHALLLLDEAEHSAPASKDAGLIAA